MFFEGSLQEGISTALRETKQVVCFVTDDGVESKQWEDEFLKDDSIRSGVEGQSVMLRLPAGSEEAGYLEALFPIPKKPTVVVIRGGQLKEYIAAGTSREEFIRRLGGTVQPDTTTQGQQPPSSITPIPTAANPPQTTQHTTAPQSSQNQDHLYDDVQPSTTTTSAAEEEARRIASADKKKGKAKAEPEAAYEPSSSSTPEKAHANKVKLQKQQANEERRRILKRIEDDKQARKERDAAERRARQLLSSSTDADEDGEATTEPAIPLHQQQQQQQPPKPGNGENGCNLQVRLLDGTTIRSRFTGDATLGNDVRRWIDEASADGGAQPYGFRIVLTPLPNRAVAPREEAETSLVELGLAPSATLVLVPARHSVAYPYGRGGYGLLSPVVGVFSSICGAVMSSVGGFFALFFGGATTGAGAGGDGIPMEDLRGGNGRRPGRGRRGDSQLYNGNSLNFEPRNEDEDEN